jgi:hypothetical protein
MEPERLVVLADAVTANVPTAANPARSQYRIRHRFMTHLLFELCESFVCLVRELQLTTRSSS